MGKTEKKLNKRIVGAIIGGTILGLGGLSMTPKGKSFWRKVAEKTKRWYGYMSEGREEMVRTFRQMTGDKS